MKELLTPVASIDLKLQNSVGDLIDNIIDHWLFGIRESQPAILDMLKFPNLLPRRNFLPWSGEFAGKYVTSSVLLYRFTRNEKLFSYLKGFIAELISCQKEDGYMGCWASEYQMTGRAVQIKNGNAESCTTWDAWAHYHLMYGLLLWYRETGDAAVYDAVLRIADMLCRLFYNPETGNRRLFDMGETEMNYAPGHAFVILYRKTGEQKYLNFALAVLRDFEAPGCGDYYRRALAGQEYYETPKPRWESLHSIQMLSELYWATGDESYRDAFIQIWKSFTKTDLHNTGGFTTDEQAIGNPYVNGMIETCCTVAYMAVTVDMLKLTGDTAAADALELSTYNTGLACFSPTGRWSTYNTPMEGDKKANYWEIGFQCRPGSPELNCCSVNAPRIFGELGNWAYLTQGDDLYINYYGESTATLTLGDATVRITQTTDYPYDGRVNITVSGLSEKRRKIYFRIPFWSEKTTVSVGGEAVGNPCPGYYLIDREWADGDTVTLCFDMSLRVSCGEGAYDGKCSLYRGPLLLCYDGFYCPDTADGNPPTVTTGALQHVKTEPAYLCGRLFYMDNAGTPLVLCDMQAAGASGTYYTTWLPAADFRRPAQQPENITRSFPAHEI